MVDYKKIMFELVLIWAASCAVVSILGKLKLIWIKLKNLVLRKRIRRLLGLLGQASKPTAKNGLIYYVQKSNHLPTSTSNPRCCIQMMLMRF